MDEKEVLSFNELSDGDRAAASILFSMWRLLSPEKGRFHQVLGYFHSQALKGRTLIHHFRQEFANDYNKFFETVAPSMQDVTPLSDEEDLPDVDSFEIEGDENIDVAFGDAVQSAAKEA